MATTFTRMDESTAEQWGVIGTESYKNQARVADRVLGMLESLSDIVDEHDTKAFEALDHQLVVNDLVVAVHRRVEGAHHPGERLDGHLHAGAEAAGRGEEHSVDGHRDSSLRVVECNPYVTAPGRCRRARVTG